MTRLVQIRAGQVRRVALVEEPGLRLLRSHASVLDLAREAAASGTPLTALVAREASGQILDYEAVYQGRSEWRLLPPVDHPGEPSRCLVSGTGLTHIGSAQNRASMHSGAESLTDSMRMFQSGVEGGRPPAGAIGAAPEWFFKGTGSILRAHDEPLEVPAFADDGGEEAEVAGAYLIGDDGTPRRIGMAAGNEFSDHQFERKNYLNLAGSKIRTCSLGPELVVDPDFDSVPGAVTIERAGATLWTGRIATGEAEMCHSLRNIEHHHFKFESHRRPGDLHIHFYGAHSLSFGAGIILADGDSVTIQFRGFGRPLRNPIRIARAPARLVTAPPLL